MTSQGATPEPEVHSSDAPGLKGIRRASAGREQLDRMVDIAARRFFEQGYDATTMQQIADEMGMLKGSLFHYVSTKDDLLWAIIWTQHQSALALIDRCTGFAGTPTERLHAFVEGYAPSLQHDRIFVSVYLRDFSRLSSERRHQIVSERVRGERLVESILVDGQRAGEFRNGFDPHLTCQGILGLLNSTYRWYRAEEGRSADAVLEEMWGLIHGGVRLLPVAG